MRTIFFTVAFVATYALALAQKPNADSIWVQPCAELYAPWGSDRNVVMAAATAAGFTFDELDQNEEQPGIFHISYVDGNYRRMFSFAHGAYIGFTLAYATGDSKLATRIANRHLATYLAVADSIVSSKSLYIMCDDQKMRTNIINNSEGVSVQVLNHTEMTNAILRFRKME